MVVLCFVDVFEEGVVGYVGVDCGVELVFLCVGV